MSLMLGKNICSTCKIRYVRCIVLSCKGSLRGADGMTHHVHARPPINLRITGHAARIPNQLPWTGHGHFSKLNHPFSMLETSRKSTPRSPSTHVDRLVRMEFVSFLAMVLVSRTKLASPTQRTRAERSCQSRDTTFVTVSIHEEAHGGWRRMG